MRITRDDMFMSIAKIVAKRGTCDRAQVGAVLVHDGKKIISIGYNGAPAGEPHCDDVGHLIENGHCVRTIHAEKNCVEFAIKEVWIEDNSPLTLYVTHMPCFDCCQRIVKAKLVEGLNIARLVFYRPYGLTTHYQRYQILREAGVEVVKFTGELVGPDSEC